MVMSVKQAVNRESSTAVMSEIRVVFKRRTNALNESGIFMARIFFSNQTISRSKQEAISCHVERYVVARPIDSALCHQSYSFLYLLM